jgi:hypothetical protein
MNDGYRQNIMIESIKRFCFWAVLSFLVGGATTQCLCATPTRAGDQQKVQREFVYGVQTPLLITYNSQKFAGFYWDGFDFTFANGKISVTKKGEPVSTPQGTMPGPDVHLGDYHYFQMVNLLDVRSEGEIGLPDKSIPAFYLKGFDDKNRWKNASTGVMLTLDVVTTVSGVGNLAKLRHLSKLRSAQVWTTAIIGGIEVASGTTQLIINYTSTCEGSEKFCERLSQYLFWLEIASLSADALTNQMLKKSAQNVLDSGVPTTIDGNVKKQLEDHAGGVAKGGANLAKYTKVDTWFKGIANATSKINIENILKNWGDDLLTKLDNVPTRNPDFLSKVEANPNILKHFEEGAGIISNRSANLKAVELDMYALDRSRTTDIVFDGYGNYVANPTKKNLAQLDINPQSGKIRDTNGNVLTTDNVNSEGLMYVIDETDNIVIGGRAGSSMPHPTLIGGKNPNVKCAGMIRFKDGRILEISNNSGHFKPSNTLLQQAEIIFKQKMPANSFDSQFKTIGF